MNYETHRYPNWIASKTMVERSDLSGDEKWILTVLIAATFAMKKGGPHSRIHPTLNGVSKAIGRSVKEVMPDFEDLRARGFISYNEKGDITDLHSDELEKNGVVDPGSITSV